MTGAGNLYAAYGRQQGRAQRMSEGDFRQLVDEARSRHNLSDIIGRHTTLKKRGGRELVGLCPFHQEKSPSFEVNDAKGTYHCWGCGEGGDAIRFLIHREGMTFREAIEALTGDQFPDVSQEERAQRKAADAADMSRRLQLARTIWSSTVPLAGTVGETYARSRGITIDLGPNVRFAMTPRWYNHETGETGRNHPAVVCGLQDVTGAIVGVQCIFLKRDGSGKFEATREDGSKAKAKLTFGIIVGSALRLGPASSHIVMCEGPEDGWTLRQELRDKAVWVPCGTALLSRVVLPSHVRSITLAGDNNEAGRVAVSQAGDAYLSQGVVVNDAFPDARFKDWNDQLRGITA